MPRGASEAVRFASTSSLTARLSRVVQRGLGDGRGLMDLRRMVASSVIVAALMTRLFKINSLIRSEDGFVEDGGGNFRGVCMGTR
jgi:hypothetical protein